MTDQPESDIPRNLSWFDPDKGFHELAVVRIALTFVSLTCLALIILISCTAPGPIAFDANGLLTIAARYRVPVAFFTLTIPFFALMAASHRSEQTKHQMILTRKQIDRTDKQILIASAQNVFSNHYKHVEEFEKYLFARKVRNEAQVERTRKALEIRKSPLADVVQPEISIDPTHYRSAYRQIFPGSKSGEFFISPSHINEIENFVVGIESFFAEFAKSSPDGWGKAIIGLHDLLYRYSESKFINISNKPSTKFTHEHETRDIFCGFVSSMVMQAMDVVEAQVDALQFDVSFEVSQPVRRFITMDRESLPDIDVENLAECPIDMSLIRWSPRAHLGEEHSNATTQTR